MRGHERHWLWMVPVSLFAFLQTPAVVLAYAGPGPGLEFIPYFLSMLAWAGAASGAVLLGPITALLRRMRKARGDSAIATQASNDDGSAGLAPVADSTAKPAASAERSGDQPRK